MKEKPLDKLTVMLLDIIRNATAKIADIADQENGVIGADAITAWRDELRTAIAQYHTAAMIAGAGGSAGSLSASMKNQLGEIVANQLNYLDGFVEKLNTGTMSSGQIRARADMYAPALRQPYSAGATAGLPLPAMPAEGTICHTNCKCSWRIVTVDEEAGDYDCFWVRGATDSCSTCIAREREWSPILVRDLTLQ